MLSKYKHRNESVSIAKGIGILLVVIGSIQEFPIVSSISNGNGVIWWMIYIVAGVFIPLIAMLIYQKVTIKINDKY
jgi:hypothetical protein